jgi:hypothetical protein
MTECSRSIPRTIPLVAVLVFCASPAATAGEASPAAAAQALFDEGKQLAAGGNYATACAKFTQSQQLDPGGGTLMHLAACHESDGKTATAWSEFNEALGWARRDGRADREAFAKARLKAIEPQLVKLTVVVAPQGSLPGFAVTRDGRVLGEQEWGKPVPVDPGEHLIEAVAPGRTSWTRRIRIDRQTGNAAAEVPALVPVAPRVAATATPAAIATPAAAVPATFAAAPAPGAAAPDSPPDSSDPGSPRRAVGIGIGAGGLAGLAVAVVFDLRAHAKASSRDDAARAGDAEATASLHNQARSAQTTAFIVGGVALAAVGTGVALYLSAPRSTSDVRVVPQVAANQVGVLLEVVR